MLICINKISRLDSGKSTHFKLKKKLFSIVFTNKQIETKTNLIFGTEHIREQEECVYLGVKLYSKLKFHSHIKTVHSKITKSIGILFILSSIFTLHKLKIIYYSLINPYMHYCNVFWSGTYQTHIEPLIIFIKESFLSCSYKQSFSMSIYTLLQYVCLKI